MEKQITAPVTYIKQTISLKKDLEKTFILLAERLYNIFTQKLWEGDGYGSFEEFLIELSMSGPMASKLISVYRKYVIEHGVALTQLSKVRSWESLYSVRSLVVDKDSALEMVERAEVNSQKDMRDLTSVKDECDRHDWVEMRFCRNCGMKERLYPSPEA